jgi:predicted Zn-dependent protease with MMP-like domain
MRRAEMERQRFERLVEQALDGLPEQFARMMTNLVVVVEDYPPSERRVVLIRRKPSLLVHNPSHNDEVAPCLRFGN